MKFLFAAVAVCVAGAANALTTVTFDHDNVTYNPANGEYIGLSQGFLYDFSYTYLTGFHIALHDDSGLIESTIRPQKGVRFTPHTVDVAGFSLINRAGSGPKPTDPSDIYAWATSGIAPIPTLSFQGIRDNQVVATQAVGPGSWSTYSFSNAFSAIDSLVLNLNIPSQAQSFFGHSFGYDAATPGLAWCEEWCGEFWTDNLVVSQVAPVPLPATAWLLIGAVASMFGFRRLRNV